MVLKMISQKYITDILLELVFFYTLEFLQIIDINRLILMTNIFKSLYRHHIL